jgi:uncharacterized protein (TIGR02679 family)
VRLEAVDAVLRRSGVCADGLAAAVVALTGPVDDRAATAERERAAWRDAFVAVDRAVAGRDDLADWVAGLQASGAVRRIAREPTSARDLLGRLALVLEALPLDPAEPVGRFAERVLGSAHALDPGDPLHGLALGAARVIGGEGDGTGAEWRRRVWASVGLVLDELSTTVLVLNLPVTDDTAVGRMLSGLREAGEPAVVTLRQLRGPLGVGEPAPIISVCENPVVVAEAADRLGADSGPLVCLGGQPGAAALTLLRRLTDSGAALRYHGDFDWPGIRIANHLASRLPFTPWRFDEGAYREVGLQGSALTGAPATPSWGPGLGRAMAEIGWVVEEERVVGDLVEDLRQGSALRIP